jgi:hypothetical protein
MATSWRGLQCALGLALAQPVLLPAASQACFPAGCPEADFVPRMGSTIPSNAPVLVYHTHQLDSQPELRLLRIDEAAEQEVPITVDAVGDSLLMLSPKLRTGDSFLIRPMALIAGARYRLERVRARCSDEFSEFQVTEAAELPRAIGELSLGPAQQGCVRVPGDSSCFTSLPAALVELELNLDGSARPWSELLQIRNLVDDQLWTPLWELRLPLPQGRTHEILYVNCLMTDPALRMESPIYMPEAGRHRVRVEARLPGTSLRLRSSERSTILMCDDERLASFADADADTCHMPPLDPRAPFAEPVQDEPDAPEEAQMPGAHAQSQPDAPPSQCDVSSPGTARSSIVHALWLAALAGLVTRRRARRP